MNKFIFSIIVATLLISTGCSRKKEALQLVDRLIVCAKDSVDRCKQLYPLYDSLNVALQYERYALNHDPKQSGDTIIVNADVIYRDDMGFKHQTKILFNVLPDEKDTLRIVSSRGLMEFSKTPMLYILAQKTGAIADTDTDADLKGKFAKIDLLGKELLGNMNELVKIGKPKNFGCIVDNEQGWRTRRLKTIFQVQIDNQTDSQLKNVVLKAKTIAGRGEYSTPCSTIDTIASLPVGKTTYTITTWSKKGVEDLGRFGPFRLVSLDVELPYHTQRRYVDSYKFTGKEYFEFCKK